MTAFPALAEAEGKLKSIRDEVAVIFAEAGPDLDFTKVKTVKGTSRDVAAHVREKNTEMEDLVAQIADLKAVEKAAQSIRTAGSHTGGAEQAEVGSGSEPFDFGAAFVKSAAYTGRKVKQTAELNVSLKTLMTTSAGWAPEVLRNGRLVDNAQRPIQVADILPQTTTGQASVKYMEETTLTNAAAEIAEGGTYPESAFALTERISPVQKIATFLPVTDEQLEDVDQIQGYLNNRLPFLIRQRLDLQILTGNGTSPNLRGVLNVVGIQTQAKGTDPIPDAVYNAMVKVQTGTGQANPDTIIMNPADWAKVRLLRTADGLYIWGNPSDTGPQSMWGLRATMAQALTAGTGVVGDFGNYSELSVRSGMDVQVSNSHSTFFIEGKQAIRADIRVALVWYRPTAFCTVTGL